MPRSATSTAISFDSAFDLTRLSLMFVYFMVVDSIILYLGHVVLPSQIVLGTYQISPLLAVIQSMLFFSLLAVVAVPVIELVAQYLKFKLSDLHWIVATFVVDFVGLWMVARLADMLGLGISSWVIVAVLAVCFDLGQGLAIRMLRNAK